MRRRWIPRLLVPLLIVTLASAACGVRWRADLAVVGLRIAEVSVLETTMVFTVRIENLEPMPLLLDGAAFEIFIEGNRVGRGLASDRMEVPRISAVELEIPVQISNIQAATEIREIIETGRFAYRIRGTLFVVRADGVGEAHISRGGVIDLSGIAP